MREEYWNLIAKHQANETTTEEDLLIDVLTKSDDEFRSALNDSKEIWNQLEEPKLNFDKERIQKLINSQISNPKIDNKYSIIRRSLKYAAIFIGFLIGAVFVYNDLNSTTTVCFNDIDNGTLVLPDGSKVTFNKNAEITYSNSLLKGFDRRVTLNGEAYFEIQKAHGANFIVSTDNYNIEVLGTKFNVREAKKGTSVTLVEGSIKLNSFENKSLKETFLVPGERAYYSNINHDLILMKVNTKIYTSWMFKRLEFNNFSISDLVDVFDLNYNKKLIILDKTIANTKIGGSAPSKDINLIMKGLSKVLKREITQSNDTIIIK